MQNMLETARRAMSELDSVFAGVAPDEVDRMAAQLLEAKRIACSGCGREGLMIRALCMRLMHHGLDAHMVGDMTTPPLGPGDLLVVSCGPGQLAAIEALVGVAKEAGATTLVVTAQPEGATAQAADVRIVIPAQTMADDLSGGASVLPMGTAFEIAELLFFDLVALEIRERTGQSGEEVRQRHTNLE